MAGAQPPFEVQLTRRHAGPRALPSSPGPARPPAAGEEAVRTADRVRARPGRAGSTTCSRASPSAETQFRKALDQDRRCVAAHTGLAYLNLDPDPAAAAQAAQAALAVDPDAGRARFALAVAEARLGNVTVALDAAWLASRDPSVAVPARALVARLLIGQGRWAEAASALQATGPWQNDLVCRNRLAFALQKQGRAAQVARLARRNLAVDPLDAFAVNLLRNGFHPG